MASARAPRVARTSGEATTSLAPERAGPVLGTLILVAAVANLSTGFHVAQVRLRRCRVA